MRAVTVSGRGAMAASLVGMVAAGCGGDEASGQKLPENPGLPAMVPIAATDGLLPGDQRAPGPPTVTTAARRWPVGRPSVPAVRTTRTAPPATTTSTAGLLAPPGP